MYWGLKFNYQYGRPYHFQFQAVNRRQKMLLQINSIKKNKKNIGSYTQWELVKDSVVTSLFLCFGMIYVTFLHNTCCSFHT